VPKPQPRRIEQVVVLQISNLVLEIPQKELLMHRAKDIPAKLPICKSLLAFLIAMGKCLAQSATLSSPTNIFAPASTPAKSIFHLSLFVITITTVIFLVVGGLLAYAVVKYRRKKDDDGREPAQVYGSNQIEIAWTVIPVIIVVVLFMATARVIADVQKSAPDNAIHVTAIGHQFWWEYRYPGSNVVTANELHVPVGIATEIMLLSADTDHSFWVPRLAGKTDLIPNHPNSMWIDPQEPGLYLGQCAQYCGTQHAKMLLRVYVQSRAEFDQWIHQQSQPAHLDDAASEGRRIFEATACVNCHTVAGTSAHGRFGPDLTHLMSRDTIAAGITANTHDNLRSWVQDPSRIKPGSLMPAMGLNDHDLEAVTAYLETLR
jgi:cytochrome c oxidase subunit II